MLIVCAAQTSDSVGLFFSCPSSVPSSFHIDNFLNHDITNSAFVFGSLESSGGQC